MGTTPRVWSYWLVVEFRHEPYKMLPMRRCCRVTLGARACEPCGNSRVSVLNTSIRTRQPGEQEGMLGMLPLVETWGAGLKQCSAVSAT